MSEQTDRNQQALDLIRQGRHVTKYRSGYSIAGGWFFDRSELTPATIAALDTKAHGPGYNPARAKPRRQYQSRRRSSAAVGLSLAYGAMAEQLDRVNGMTPAQEFEHYKSEFAAQVEAAKKGQ